MTAFDSGSDLAKFLNDYESVGSSFSDNKLSAYLRPSGVPPKRSKGERSPSPFRVAVFSRRRKALPDSLRRTRSAAIVYYHPGELPRLIDLLRAEQ